MTRGSIRRCAFGSALVGVALGVCACSALAPYNNSPATTRPHADVANPFDAGTDPNADAAADGDLWLDAVAPTDVSQRDGRRDGAVSDGQPVDVVPGDVASNDAVSALCAALSSWTDSGGLKNTCYWDCHDGSLWYTIACDTRTGSCSCTRNGTKYDTCAFGGPITCLGALQQSCCR